jgi:hypothetical protein
MRIVYPLRAGRIGLLPPGWSGVVGQTSGLPVRGTPGSPAGLRSKPEPSGRRPITHALWILSPEGAILLLAMPSLRWNSALPAAWGNQRSHHLRACPEGFQIANRKSQVANRESQRNHVLNP